MHRNPSPVASVRPLLALAALGALVTLTGCGSLPTAPVATQAQLGGGVQAQAASPVLLPVDPGDAGTPGAEPNPSVPPPVGVATDVLTGFTTGTPATGVTSTSAPIGPAGGALTNGHWRLYVPPRALSGTALFTLTVAGSRGAACQVQVDPGVSSAAAWTLSVNCSAQNTDQIKNWVMLSYDTRNGAWSKIQGSGANRHWHSVIASVTGAGIYGVGLPNGTPAW